MNKPWYIINGEISEDLIRVAPDMYKAMQEFVDRVDNGQVRSRYTYHKFKAILAKAKRD